MAELSDDIKNKFEKLTGIDPNDLSDEEILTKTSDAATNALASAWSSATEIFNQGQGGNAGNLADTNSNPLAKQLSDLEELEKEINDELKEQS